MPDIEQPLKIMVFDMDGVLVDSGLLWRTGIVNFYGIEVPIREASRFAGPSNARAWEMMHKWQGDRPGLEESRAAWKRERADLPGYADMPNPYVSFSLERLQAGGLAIAITSSSMTLSGEHVEIVRSIADRLDEVVTGNKCTKGKPIQRFTLPRSTRLACPLTKRSCSRTRLMRSPRRSPTTCV